MGIRDMVGGVTNIIPVENVLISVYHKEGLEDFVFDMIDINPNIRFISTGGTYRKIKEAFGDKYGDNLIEVAKYTGFPEMPGDLVKTLHPKIFAGLLGERNNPEHQEYLKKTLNGGVFIDMAVVNFYPFKSTVAKKGITFEEARGKIDIGGPAMVRAAAKNFPGCAAVCNPYDYKNVARFLRNNNGATDFDFRFQLFREAFRTTDRYDKDIVKYLGEPRAALKKARKEYGLAA